MEDEVSLWVAEETFLCWGKGLGNAGEMRAGVIESV